MKLVARLQYLGSYRTWRMIVNLWTMVFFAAIIFDFFHSNELADDQILLGIAGVYAAVLAIYSAEKEFRRWHNMHSSLHPGEMYVMLWTALVVFLVIGATFYNPAYHMPSEVSAAYIAVVSILAITRESKNYYRRKRKNR